MNGIRPDGSADMPEAVGLGPWEDWGPEDQIRSRSRGTENKSLGRNHPERADHRIHCHSHWDADTADHSVVLAAAQTIVAEGSDSGRSAVPEAVVHDYSSGMPSLLLMRLDRFASRNFTLSLSSIALCSQSH